LFTTIAAAPYQRLELRKTISLLAATRARTLEVAMISAMIWV
jgi:hypothetical protein